MRRFVLSSLLPGFAVMLLLLRVPNSEVEHLRFVQHGVLDGLMILLGVGALALQASSRDEEGTAPWWAMGPPLMLLSTGVLGWTGADWLLFRRCVGVEVIALALLLLAESAGRLQGTPRRLAPLLAPILGLSTLAGGVAAVAPPGPLSPFSLACGLLYVLSGLGILASPGAGRLEDRPSWRILAGLVVLASGVSRLLPLPRPWSILLALLGVVTFGRIHQRELDANLEEWERARSRSEES